MEGSGRALAWYYRSGRRSLSAPRCGFRNGLLSLVVDGRLATSSFYRHWSPGILLALTPNASRQAHSLLRDLIGKNS